jgi:SsrA-binding protein
MLLEILLGGAGAGGRLHPAQSTGGPPRSTWLWRSDPSSMSRSNLDPPMAKRTKRKAAPGDVATNRRASYRFNLLDRMEAGMVLTGTEVKSLREGRAQLKDGYATVEDGEVWLHNVHIPPYGPAARANHDPERDRKLLLHRRQIDRLIGQTRERGLTLVPTRIYFSGPHAKVELALARGKDRFDKREAIREREMARDAERAMRDFRR